MTAASTFALPSDAKAPRNYWKILAIVLLIVIAAGAVSIAAFLYLPGGPLNHSNVTISGNVNVYPGYPSRVDFTSSSGTRYSAIVPDSGPDMNTYSISVPNNDVYSVSISYIIGDQHLACDGGSVHVSGANSSTTLSC
jgi:hypothetical protein